MYLNKNTKQKRTTFETNSSIMAKLIKKGLHHDHHITILLSNCKTLENSSTIQQQQYHRRTKQNRKINFLPVVNFILLNRLFSSKIFCCVEQKKKNY